MSIGARRLQRAGTTVTELVRDSFTRINPSGIGVADTGQTWNILLGTFAVSDTRANVADGNNSSLALINASVANMHVAADVSSPIDGKWIGIVARASSNGATYYGVETSSLDNTLKIFRYVNWVRTDLATVTGNQVRRLALDVTGTNTETQVTAYLNGNLAWQGIDTGTQLPSGTYAGLRTGSMAAGAVWFDNFAASPSSAPRYQLNSLNATIPQSDLPGWRLVAAEDFNDDVPVGGFAAVNGNWNLVPAGAPGYDLYKDRLYVYPEGQPTTGNLSINSPQKTLSTHDSYADIYFHTENSVAYAAALIPRFTLGNGGVDQTYGRYSIRMKSDGMAAGFGAVSFLWPSDNVWPQNGEIDWPEGDVTGSIEGFQHYALTPDTKVIISTPLHAQWADWHVYTIEWTPGKVKCFIDDMLCLESSEYIPVNPMRFLIQSGVHNAAPASSVMGHLLIDWMCVWQYAP